MSFYGPADYSKNGTVMKYMKKIIDDIASKEAIKMEQAMLKQPAETYRLKESLGVIGKQFEKDIKPKEKKELDKFIKELEEIIPGNNS